MQRVRGVATNLFESGARLDFRAPPSEELAAIELDPSARRHPLFLLQEALNNASRHAGARAVEVAFELSARPPARPAARRREGLRLPERPRRVHGLASMRRRAHALGAAFSLDSAAGRGTTLDLDVAARAAAPHLVRWRRRRPARSHRG